MDWILFELVGLCSAAVVLFIHWVMPKEKKDSASQTDPEKDPEDGVLIDSEQPKKRKRTGYFW